MTTSHSPLRVLKAQADKIAATLKAAERGEAIDAQFAERLKAARLEESFKFAIVMDDKMVVIELAWTKIKECGEVALTAFILKAMRDKREGLH